MQANNKNKQEIKFKPHTFKRLLGLMWAFKGKLIFALTCIVISSVVGASTALFLRVIIDDYILPAVAGGGLIAAGLIRVILTMALVYALGIVTNYAANYTMIFVEQGTLKNIRDQMYTKMQSLSIGYFDSHAVGDVMSRYTNDTDSLRQAISQSIPQVFASFISTMAAFFSMLYLSVWLTAFVVLFSVVLFLVLKVIVKHSSRYFVKQQSALGTLNAYIEEMIKGQKVVKVFNRETQTKADFDTRNEDLSYAATQANKFSNVMMPVVGNFGYLLYVLLAVVGGAAGIAGLPNLRLTGVDTLTIGTIISFLTLSRSFINPIGQISMQINMIVMAVAGAERIFELMDQEPEEDEG
ncbi:MAG: ABC transporter ATP-binding protein, partial [Clostridiales bacterium]|nr:ABC transporter ATP-binding protein [Clostridiales bacterium]